MRRMKISKLVSVVLAVAMLMFSVVSVNAASTVTGTIENLDKAEITVTVKIESKDAAEAKANLAGASVIVLAPVDDETDEDKNGIADAAEAAVEAMIESGVWDEEVVAGIGHVYAANGEGSCVITLEDAIGTVSGVYTIVATATDTAVGTLYFAAPKTRQNIIKQIVAEETSAAAAAKLIDDNAKILGIDEEVWDVLSDTEKQAAAADIKVNAAVLEAAKDETEEESPISDAIKAMDAEILTAALNAKKIDDIADQADKVEDKEAIEIYNGMSPAAQSYAMNLLTSKNFANAADMEAKIKNIMKVAFVANDGDLGTVNMPTFAQYVADLGIDTTAYSKLTPTQQRSVITAVEAAKPTDSLTLKDAFDEAVTDAGKPEPSGDKDSTTIDKTTPGSGTGVGGGSGSGAGAGAGSSTTDQIKYIDLGNHAWAEEAIYALSNKGVLAGYGDGIFSPANQIKREEFAKVIVAALYGETAVNADKVPTFVDAQNGWYSPFVGYAESTGIVKGISATEFGVGRNITRQDIMTILYRVMQSKGYAANTTPIAYGDAAQISDYAKDAVFALANAGVVGGYEDGTMRPLGDATRAEVAVMIYKFLNLFA